MLQDGGLPVMATLASYFGITCLSPGQAVIPELGATTSMERSALGQLRRPQRVPPQLCRMVRSRLLCQRPARNRGSTNYAGLANVLPKAAKTQEFGTLRAPTHPGLRKTQGVQNSKSSYSSEPSGQTLGNSGLKEPLLIRTCRADSWEFGTQRAPTHPNLPG